MPNLLATGLVLPSGPCVGSCLPVMPVLEAMLSRKPRDFTGSVARGPIFGPRWVTVT